MKNSAYKNFFFIPIVFLFVNASPYDNPKFVTLSECGAKFPVQGKIEKLAQYEDISTAPVNIRKSNYRSIITFNEAGFYGLIVTENGRHQFYSVFVSPVPTVHADKTIEDFNWYQSQFNSGTLSNCGPASAAMAISFTTGKYISTAMVRDAVGWQGDGATSFEQLIKVIKIKNDTAKILPLKRFEQIKDVIDSGGIAIVGFKTDGVASNKNNPEKYFFDKYYVDNVGHYIIVKGYSKDGEYLVVYDPIPSDWSGNKFRHRDGISMIGKNRYYKTDELLSSLRRSDMIAVMRIGNGN